MSVAIANPAFNTVPQPVGVSTITIAANGEGTDAVAVGSGTAAGTIGPRFAVADERQLFGLQITAGDTVTINANPVVGSALDTVLKVFLPDVTAETNSPRKIGFDGVDEIPLDPFVIAENDDIGVGNFDSSVTFTATVTGLHYVSVASFLDFFAQAVTPGDFTLSVSGVTNPGTTGADAIIGGVLNDVFEGNLGADIISGGDGSDVLLGQGEADIIYGNRDTDILYGGNGNDSIFAGQNNAVNADGTAAIDTVLNPATGGLRQVQVGGTESVFGGSGDDLLYGNFGTDVVHGDSGADTIFGGQGDDQTFGGSENDLLFGNRGNDIMMGNTGNDTLNGGSGNDTMQGNAGNDVFVFNAGSGTDVIMDFEAGVDVIQVSANLNGNLTTTIADYVDAVRFDLNFQTSIINLGNSADGSVNEVKLTGVLRGAVTEDFFIFG